MLPTSTRLRAPTPYDVGDAPATRHARASWFSTRYGFLRLAIVGSFLAMALPLALWGPVQTDEHFYLAAGRAVAEGELPYVDFPLFQGPLVAFFYGISQSLATGLLSARMLNLALGCATLLLGMHVAERLGGRTAALAAGAMMALTPGWLLHATLAHSTLLSGFLVVAAAAALLRREWGAWRWAAAAALLALAAGTRLNIALALGLLFMYALATGERRARDAMIVATAGGATLLLVYAPFLLLAPEAMRWGLVEYHLTDSVAPGASFLSTLVERAYGVQGLLMNHVFLLCVLGGGIALAVLDRRARIASPHARDVVFLGLVAAWVVGSMFVKPGFILYYLYPALPLLAALGGVAVVAFFRSAGSARRPVVVALATLALLNFAAAAPSVIDFPEPLQSQAVMAEVATLLEARLPEGEAVFTFHPAFAIEAARPLSPNLEMGPFSYVADVEAPDAERLLVVSNEVALERFENAEPGAVVLAGHDFARTTQLMHVPHDQAAQVAEIRAALDENYDLAYERGDGDHSVEVWLRHDL